MDERIISFLDYLHNDPTNTSQLLSDFQDFYLHRHEKLFIPDQNIKRLFFGYMRKDGLFAHLKECHKDHSSVKTRQMYKLCAALLDCNKSHQVDDFKRIWRQQPLPFVQECHLEVIIKKEQALKESAFIMLAAYMENRVFQVEALIKDPIACQMFGVWSKNKSRV